MTHAHHSGSSSTPWDLVVIGGGSAGLVAAQTAAGFGRRVMLIDRREPGGDCLWTGCVPSKALIAAAESAAPRSGLGVTGERHVDFTAVMDHVHGAIATIAPVDSAETLENAGIRVLKGTARFTGRTSLDVDGRPVTFRQAVIATGAEPVSLDVPGIDLIDARTSATLWDLTELPDRLVVVGGGPVGCELAQAFARLGSRTVLVQRGPRLIPTETADASHLIADALRDDGVDVRLSTTVDDIDGGGAHLSDGTIVEVGTLLAAIGRRPETDGLCLAAAGIRVDVSGHVIVDDGLRTTNPFVRAAGDVTAFPNFTHTAGMNGSTAAIRAIVGLGASADRRPLRVTFTRPEVAAVGMPVDEADPERHRVVTVQHADIDRAIVEGATRGFTRLVLDRRRGRVLGGVIVSPRAGETIGEIALAIAAKASLTSIARTTHPYPTFSNAFWNACVTAVQEGLRDGVVGAALGVLIRVRALRIRR